jgi:hypothetical protein
MKVSFDSKSMSYAAVTSLVITAFLIQGIHVQTVYDVIA